MLEDILGENEDRRRQDAENVLEAKRQDELRLKAGYDQYTESLKSIEPAVELLRRIWDLAGSELRAKHSVIGRYFEGHRVEAGRARQIKMGAALYIDCAVSIDSPVEPLAGAALIAFAGGLTTELHISAVNVQTGARKDYGLIPAETITEAMAIEFVRNFVSWLQL